MNIMINGETVTTQATTLANLIKEYGAKPPFAVAVNGDFVANTEYAAFTVHESDQVDIVSPIYGG